MIVWSDKVSHHAIFSIACSLLACYLLFTFSSTILDEAVYVGGVTIGVVLAGFTSQNRTLLVAQKKTDLMLEVGQDSGLLAQLMCLFRNTIRACVVLAAISILSLCLPSLQNVRLFVWLPVVIFTLTYFLRCELTVDKMINCILRENRPYQE